MSIVELMKEFAAKWNAAVNCVIVFSLLALIFLALFVVRQNTEAVGAVRNGKKKRVVIDILLGIIGVAFIVVVSSYLVWAL